LVITIGALFYPSTGLSQDEPIRLSQLEELGERSYQSGQHFYSYFYNSTVFFLSSDSIRRSRTGKMALTSAVRGNRVAEAELMMESMVTVFSYKRSAFQQMYGYLLSANRRFAESDVVLSNVRDSSEAYALVPVLRAYNRLNLNDRIGAIGMLEKIHTSAPWQSECREIRAELEKPVFKTKSRFIAGALSAAIPGSGQMYAGLWFDGIQSLGFNAVTGYAAFASWRYEESKNKRNYVLPVLSTAVAAAFYLTNVYGAINSIQRVNRYHEGEFYRKIIGKMNVILEQNGAQLMLEHEF
jgi:hypothetical protein